MAQKNDRDRRCKDTYHEMLSLYFRKISKDLSITENGFGLIILLARNEHAGGTDLASNLTDETMIGILEDILKTMKAQKT